MPYISKRNIYYEKKSEIKRRSESARTTSRILWEERINASQTGGGQHHEPEPNRREVKRQNKVNRIKNLDSSFLSADERISCQRHQRQL
jgi:hypothetical protein